MAVQEYGAAARTGRARPEAGQGPVHLGTLPSHGLPRLLLQIAARRLTGQLLLNGPGTERVVSFAYGYPIYADSSHPEERLGAFAQRAGLVDATDLEAAFAHARARGSQLGNAMLDLASQGVEQLISAQKRALAEG